jgi:peroxiredoxin
MLAVLMSGVARADSVKTRVPDVDGAVRQPLANTGQHAVVLFFITNDCPITNSYAPEMERICNRYKSQGVRFYAVYVDPAVSAADAKKHAQAYGLTCTALYDAHHNLVKRCAATVTPEAVVVLPEGSIAYRGRIDDRYIDFGKARYHATTHDLIDAISAVLKHKPPAAARTKAIGCYIPPLQ